VWLTAAVLLVALVAAMIVVAAGRSIPAELIASLRPE